MAHNSGGKRHPRPDEAKEQRILALLDGEPVLGPGPDFVAESSRQGERKFHIGNVAYSATESDLRELFSSVGAVVECHLFLDSFDGRSRGFAVLRVCGNAFELDGMRFQGRELRIDDWDR
jgi:RNA recognition motif. (a.k.a. RRM, RBD, or RNP domain)